MDAVQLAEKVKARLRITNSKHDAFLQEVAPDHLEYAKVYCNNEFTVDGVEKIPGPVINFVAQACEYNMNPTGLEARTLGDVSYNFETDFPVSMMRKLKPYRRVRFV